MRRPKVTDRVGQQLGNYRLVSLLGQGGYAEVYLGQHVRFKQQAAIKVLHAHLSDVEAEHFQQEAETIATLAHPAIIRVLDFDVQDGIPFLVMDYAPNGSLRQRYPKGSLVPLPVIVSSVKQVAEALQYAHEQKFIHRDVKPENMLVGKRQEILLSDFGIATLAHSTSSLSTSAEGTSGTLAYMAPEQIEGHPRAASDQYALGIVVYEWLCGERPFEGSVSELIAQQLSMAPPSLRERVPEISPEIEQVVLRALAKDPKARFASVKDFAEALEQASQHVLSSTAKHTNEQPLIGLVNAKSYETALVEPGQPLLPTETTPSAELPVGALEPTIYPDASTPNGLRTPPSDTPQQGQLLAPTAAVVSPPLEPTMPVQRKTRRLSRKSAALLIGLVVLIIVGSVLGSVSLLTHFGLPGTRSATAAMPVRGGTWTEAINTDPDSLLPNQGNGQGFWIDGALYLPLFYGDARGFIQPGAASEIPTVHNGGISADGKTWTFHLRPHLVWSDGAPYDARDVDFTWKLWVNPKFNAYIFVDPTLFSGTNISADDLSITFHLTRAYAPFLSYWVGGANAPWPAHQFSTMPVEAILKSPDILNPRVVSGPFQMAESVPSDHYTVVRNPRYHKSSEGLPYLDRIIFRPLDENAAFKDLEAGTIDSYGALLDVSKIPVYQRLSQYMLVASPADPGYEALWFNFHNTVLANHLEVRQAIAYAIDHQALITQARLGYANPLCTDHPSFFHPGYDPDAPCPDFNPAAANKLLADNGWVRGTDGVRTKGGQRLEFEFSTNTSRNSSNDTWRITSEDILQRNLQAVGIKLDIQNYPANIFFGPFMTGGRASPPTGAVAGRYDIAEYGFTLGYDPDDSSIGECDQIPPNGYNWEFYCNHALDALYKQELATVDDAARQQIFLQIHQIYLTDFPFIVLYSGTDVSIVRKGTHNYQTNIGDPSINSWQWWCDGGKC
jgi:ABC-type transport system substrate-binding protein/serine/threonine protein kinase